MALLQEVTGEAIAVVDGADGERFQGVVYEASITRAYLRRSDEMRREEHENR